MADGRVWISGALVCCTLMWMRLRHIAKFSSTQENIDKSRATIEISGLQCSQYTTECEHLLSPQIHKHSH